MIYRDRLSTAQAGHVRKFETDKIEAGFLHLVDEGFRLLRRGKTDCGHMILVRAVFDYLEHRKNSWIDRYRSASPGNRNRRAGNHCRQIAVQLSGGLAKRREPRSNYFVEPRCLLDSQRLLEAGLVRRDQLPVGDRLVGDLHMILKSVGVPPPAHRLNRTGRVRCEHFGAVRKPGDFGTVPLECFDARGKAGEYRIALARGGQFNLGKADFRACHRRYRAAKSFREKLVAKADSEKRPAKLNHPFPDRLLFRPQPGMGFLFPDVHGSAHRDHQIVAPEIGYGLAGIELDRVPMMSALRPEIAKHAGVLDRNVLEYQDVHHLSLSVISSPGLPRLVTTTKCCSLILPLPAGRGSPRSRAPWCSPQCHS